MKIGYTIHLGMISKERHEEYKYLQFDDVFKEEGIILFNDNEYSEIIELDEKYELDDFCKLDSLFDIDDNKFGKVGEWFYCIDKKTFFDFVYNVCTHRDKLFSMLVYIYRSFNFEKNCLVVAAY